MDFQFSVFNFQPKKGEIATVLTIATVAVVTVSSVISSFFVNQNRQTSSAKAGGQVLCPNPADNEKWYCAGECASQSVRNLFNGTYPPDGSGRWRNEKAASCNISPTQCQSTTSCSVPQPTPNCPSGKLNVNGACDPACCSSDQECSENNPKPQKCLNPNGYCRSGTSCAVVNPTSGQAQFIRKCTGTNNATCAWVGCSQEEINQGICSIDTNNPKPQSLKCNSHPQCGATPTAGAPFKSPTPTRNPAATNTPTPGGSCAGRDQSCGFAGNQSKQCCSSSDECRTTGFTNMTCVSKSAAAPTNTPTPTPIPGCAQTNQSCGFASNQTKSCCNGTDQCRSTGATNMTCVPAGAVAPTSTPTPPRAGCWSDGTQCNTGNAGNCCTQNVCTFWSGSYRCGYGPSGNYDTDSAAPITATCTLENKSNKPITIGTTSVWASSQDRTNQTIPTKQNVVINAKQKVTLFDKVSLQNDHGGSPFKNNTSYSVHCYANNDGQNIFIKEKGFYRAVGGEAVTINLEYDSQAATLETGEIKVQTTGSFNAGDTVLVSVKDYNNPGNFSKEEPITPQSGATYVNTFSVPKIDSSYEIKIRLSRNGSELNPNILNCAGWLQQNNNCYVKGTELPVIISASYPSAAPVVPPEEKVVVTATCSLTNNSSQIIQGRANYGLSDNGTSQNNPIYSFSYNIEPGQTYYFLTSEKLQKYNSLNGLQDVQKGAEYDFSCWAQNTGSPEVITQTTKVKGGESTVINLESRDIQIPDLNQKTIVANITAEFIQCNPSFYFEGYFISGYHQQQVGGQTSKITATENLIVQRPADDSIKLNLATAVRNKTQPLFVDYLTEPLDVKFSEIPDNYKWEPVLRYNCTAKMAQVWIRSNGFDPSEIKIAKGTPILWRNADTKAHTLVNVAFDSGSVPISPNEIFILPGNHLEYGSYDYHSYYFPELMGTIFVQPQL